MPWVFEAYVPPNWAMGTGRAGLPASHPCQSGSLELSYESKWECWAWVRSGIYHELGHLLIIPCTRTG